MWNILVCSSLYFTQRLIADGLTTEYHDVPYIMQIYSSAILPYTNIAKGWETKVIITLFLESNKIYKPPCYQLS